MKINFTNLIEWSFKLWLLIFPWQTLLIIRQVEKNGSLFSAAGVALPLSAIFLGLILIAVLVRGKIKFNYGVIGLILFLGLAVWRAPDSLLGLQSLVFWILGCGVMYLSVKNILSSKEWVYCLALGAILPALLGLYQFFTQSSFSSTALGLSNVPSFLPGAPVIVGEWGRWLRASGPFPHPNIFAGYLVVIMAAIFSGLRQENIFTEKGHWFFRFLIIFSTAALIATFSRTGILAFIILLGVEFFQLRKHESAKLQLLLFAAGLTALAGIGLLWPVYVGRIFFSAPVIQETAAITERLTGASDALLLWKEHWFLGVGLGNYPIALAKLYPNLAGFALQPVHNVGLLFLAEWGLLGMVLAGFVAHCLFKKGLFKPKILLAWLPLLPLLLFDHYVYDIWAGIVILSIHISSTVYPHLCSTKPKN